MGVLLLLGVDEAKWPWLPHRAAPAQQDGPSKERGCARVAEGGTGRRPHARPEAALPSAKPAALTQYRNSSPNCDLDAATWTQLGHPLLDTDRGRARGGLHASACYAGDWTSLAV
jgi:hypothetical protein